MEINFINMKLTLSAFSILLAASEVILLLLSMCIFDSIDIYFKVWLISVSMINLILIFLHTAKKSKYLFPIVLLLVVVPLLPILLLLTVISGMGC